MAPQSAFELIHPRLVLSQVVCVPAADVVRGGADCSEIA